MSRHTLQTDAQGNRLTGADARSAADFDAAVDLLARFRADPLAAADGLIDRQPEFVMGHILRATLFMLAVEPFATPELSASLDAARALSSGATLREKMHLEALSMWRDGDYLGASSAYARLNAAFPRDLLALLAGHGSDFFTGRKTMLAERIRLALPFWGQDLPGRSFLDGMLAFGLEETGNYDAAVEAGERALAVVPDDSWAIHAIAHCHEMRRAPEAGIRWLQSTASMWQENALLVVHNWWHLALFHLAVGDAAGALQLYDAQIRPQPGAPALALVDASAMLWRLQLAGVDVGDRFESVSDSWDITLSPENAHGHYGFNDLHAAMAHAGAGRLDRAVPQLADLALRAAGSGGHARALAVAGVPLVQAIYKFAGGDTHAAGELLRLHAKEALRLGGSDAQREILNLTIVAAGKGGADRQARAA